MDPLSSFFWNELHILRPQQRHQDALFIHHFRVGAIFLVPTIVGCQFLCFVRSWLPRMRSHFCVSTFTSTFPLLYCGGIIRVKWLLKSVKQVEKVVQFYGKLLASLLHDKLCRDSRFLTQLQSLLWEDFLEVVIWVLLPISIFIALAFRAKNSLSIFAIFYRGWKMARTHQIGRMYGLFWHIISRFEQVVPNCGHIYLRSQQNCILAQHQPQFVHACGCQSWHENGLGNISVSFGLSMSLLEGPPNFSEHLTGLRWKDTDENYVTLFHNMFVVEFGNHAKFLLKWAQKVRLSCWNQESEIVETVWNF